MKIHAGVVVHFIALQIFLGLFAATCGRADTPLAISSSPPLACLTDAELYTPPPQVTSSFTLSGVSGAGTVQSTVTGNGPMLGGPPEAFI